MSKQPSKASRNSVLGKKKGGHTPERRSSTPTASTASIHGQQDRASDVPSIDAVLQGRDIEQLRISEDTLKKLHPPKTQKPPQQKKPVKVRISCSDEPAKQSSKRVSVLRPLDSKVAVDSTKLLGSPRPGLRFNKTGSVVQHSVLGSTSQYLSELEKKQVIGPSTSNLTPHIVLTEEEPAPAEDTMCYERTVVPRETNALKHWETSMKDRRQQQQAIAKKIVSSPEKLAMNQGDGYRTTQEERTLVDQAIPAVDYGKGYRTGNEYWSQEQRIGNEETGIGSTLTQTQQGLQPDLEFVGVPLAIRREKGLSLTSERNAPLHYTWRKSSYLNTRLQQIGTEFQVHRPSMSGLQVVGNQPSLEGRKARSDSLDSSGEHSSSFESFEEVGQESILDMEPEAYSQPVVGPALRIGKAELKWEEPNSISKSAERRSKSTKHLSPVDARVVFEAGIDELTTSFMEMENFGTTAVYYSWHPLPKHNPLGTIQAGDTQRFFFDTKGGVLLPGQRTDFPFLFKSPNVGIFSERWNLRTGPVLCGGEPIHVTLKGIAFQEDLYSKRRQEIEQMLSHRVAVSAAERVVRRLVETIATPPASPPPLQLAIMEEDVFLSKNPELHYHYNLVQRLKSLHEEAFRPEPKPSKKEEENKKKDKGSKDKKDPDAKKGKVKVDPSVHEVQFAQGEVEDEIPHWDLSIESLQEAILNIKDDVIQEEKLKELSSIVGKLSFPPHKVTRKKMYIICYEVLCEAIDNIAVTSVHLCQMMGIPVKEFSMGQSKTPEQDALESTPSSPVVNKDKKGSKKDSKTKLSNKLASNKGKGVQAKKSKTNVNKDQAEERTEKVEIVVPPPEVDPITLNKYSENLFTSVYEILGAAVERISYLFESDST